MKRAGWIGAATIVVLLLACGDEPRQKEATDATDVVVTFDNGNVSLAEVEKRAATTRTPACRAARRTGIGGSLEQLVPCYREVSEGLVLERLIEDETPDIDRAIEGLGKRYFELRRQAFLGPYHRRLQDEFEVRDEEVEAFFAENREKFRQPARRTLWNIFRRHQDGTKPEETNAFLALLKERYLTGEPFGSLAREYSQSETRLRDGLVGPVSEGKLPPRLEQIAFALGEGEVSDPIQVRGGAVLLHVRNLVDGVDPNLEGMQNQIRRQLRQKKLKEKVSQRIAGRKPPEGSVVLEPEELIAALADEDPEHVVFEIIDERLTAAELRELAAIPPTKRMEALEDADRDRLLELYHQRTQQQLLLIELLESTDPDLRRQAEEQLRRQGLSELVDEKLRAQMWQQIDGDSEQLRQYYEDNRTHYQNPLRFKLVAWHLPFGDDPPRQLERMEELHGTLSTGELDLTAAVEILGGSVQELGWQDFDDLTDKISSKARAYLLQVETGAFSVPFQDDDTLHLLQVEQREEPRLLEYEEVKEQVREDYFERFQQRLYREVAEARLAAADFLFHEDAVRQLLAPPVVSSPSPTP